MTYHPLVYSEDHNETPTALIRQIVDRCHVGESNRAVIRYMASRIKGGVRGFLKLPRATRKSLMRQAFTRHKHNLQEYIMVMRGM